MRLWAWLLATYPRGPGSSRLYLVNNQWINHLADSFHLCLICTTAICSLSDTFGLERLATNSCLESLNLTLKVLSR
jgi:hypothetical protein